LPSFIGWDQHHVLIPAVDDGVVLVLHAEIAAGRIAGEEDADHLPRYALLVGIGYGRAGELDHLLEGEGHLDGIRRV